ncbi:hypothetical protein C8R43DRAFT_1190438 [Mycena crocata]|nr:hypothetical protein C8R43DRAFT_1190438 [Mycena crocata]
MLQPELEFRHPTVPAQSGAICFTGQWAAASKPHIIVKLLSPPQPTSLAGEYERFWAATPLHVADKAGNIEPATLLLKAGTAMNKGLAMMRLLLEHGVSVDAEWGVKAAARACSTTPARSEIGTWLSCCLKKVHRGHFGTALGFTRGAKAEVTVPLFVLLDGGPPYPHRANLLYKKEGKGSTRWEGLPLGEGKKRLMALLIAHGVSKETTMAFIAKYLAPLANEARWTEPEYLEIVTQMIEEAEEANPEVLTAGDK